MFVTRHVELDRSWIKVCSKWISDSNFEVAFPLTQDLLKYICCGNDTDEIKFVGVLHAIRAVTLEVVQRRLNMKEELSIIIIIRIITIYIVVIFILHIFIMVKISLAPILSNMM